MSIIHLEQTFRSPVAECSQYTLTKNSIKPRLSGSLLSSELKVLACDLVPIVRSSFKFSTASKSTGPAKCDRWLTPDCLTLT